METEIAFAVMAVALLVAVGGLIWFLVDARRPKMNVPDLLRGETDRLRQIFDEQARGLRVELGNTLSGQIGNLGTGLSSLRDSLETSHAALRAAVEGRLDAMRTENMLKLEEMRHTVDEKLQLTLETRLGESFKRVAEQLERVHQGIGEMQTLAAGVSDLRKVLTNVRVRGTFGENQVGMLLEQFLSPEQYIRNAQMKEHSQERIEFAVRLPGRDSEAEVLLPIDAKFPKEDYDRLIAAEEEGDLLGVEAARKALEQQVRSWARDIKEKYINPPRTTDFAILFLPMESLYAEVLRRPGLFDQIQRDCHVTLSGPTTLTALLNALQMGFRTLAIEKRSSEVWRLLGDIQAEFGSYDAVIVALARQLQTAANSVRKLNTRASVMKRKLKDVQKASPAEIGIDPGAEFALAAPDEVDESDLGSDE